MAVRVPEVVAASVPGSNGLCVKHWHELATVDQPPPEAPGEHDELRCRLHIRPDAYLDVYPLDGVHVGERWAGYKAELLTVAPDDILGWASYPRGWGVVLPGTTSQRIVIRFRAWKLGSKGTLTLTWHPHHGEWLRLEGPRRELVGGKLQQFLKLVRHWSLGGRPEGSGKLYPDESEWRAHIAAVGRKTRRATGKRGCDFGDEGLAARLDVSRALMYARNKDFTMDMDDLRAVFDS